MKSKTQLLSYFTYGILLLSASILLNDIREFDFNQFKEFTAWARTADKNSSWFTSKNLIEISYYALSAALFFWRGYLIYSFTHFLKIIEKIEEGDYFSKTVSKYFKKIGNAFIYYTLNVFGLKLIMALIGSYSFKFINEFKDELTYLIPAGLAFFVLAELFDRARKLQEENDLTI